MKNEHENKTKQNKTKTKNPAHEPTKLTETARSKQAQVWVVALRSLHACARAKGRRSKVSMEGIEPSISSV